MSDVTTWAVLSDGRYIRVLFNKGADNTLLTLKADDSQALADLSYEVVRGVKPGATDGTASKTKSDMQLLADFLAQQLDDSEYDRLILVAPQGTLDELQQVLTDEVKQTVAGQLADDLLATSVDDIENMLAEQLQAARE